MAVEFFFAKSGLDIRAAQYLMKQADIKMTANIYTHNDKSTAVSAAKLLRTTAQ